jgi:hypothetical protein
MFDILASVFFAAGLGLLVFLAVKVGSGATDLVNGLFVAPTLPARPRGTQEDDLPPLVFPDAPFRVVVARDLDAKAA